MVGVEGLDSRTCGCLVVRGHNAPPERCSVPLILQVPKKINGRSGGIRTPDILLPKQARSQLRYTPLGMCAEQTDGRFSGSEIRSIRTAGLYFEAVFEHRQCQ